MDHYLQFCEERRAGKYRDYKYPNLVELRGQRHLYLGYFANVTEDLVLAAFRGEEELNVNEIYAVAFYNDIPFSVLINPKLVMLDMTKGIHRELVREVDTLYAELQAMAENGNQKAKLYLKHTDMSYQNFSQAAGNNRLSYIHYRGCKEEISDNILFATPKPPERDIKRRRKQ